MKIEYKTGAEISPGEMGIIASQEVEVFDEAQAAKYLGTVNSDDFIDFPAGTLKVLHARQIANRARPEVQWEFLYRPDGWDKRILVEKPSLEKSFLGVLKSILAGMFPRLFGLYGVREIKTLQSLPFSALGLVTNGVRQHRYN